MVCSVLLKHEVGGLRGYAQEVRTMQATCTFRPSTSLGARTGYFGTGWSIRYCPPATCMSTFGDAEAQHASCCGSHTGSTVQVKHESEERREQSCGAAWGGVLEGGLRVHSTRMHPLQAALQPKASSVSSINLKLYVQAALDHPLHSHPPLLLH